MNTTNFTAHSRCDETAPPSAAGSGGWRKWAAWTLGAAASVWAAAPLPASAGGGPENVVVVVNRDSWSSKAIANEFVRLRGIPPSNVVYLDAPPSLERIGVQAFREKILTPILGAVTKRGLADQTDYIVYSSDFPWSVSLQEDLKNVEVPKQITPVGSITGLTYLYQIVSARNPAYVDLRSNRYFRLPTAIVQSLRLSPELRKLVEKIPADLQAKRFEEAEESLRRLLEAAPEIPSLHFHLASALVGRDEPEEALDSLEEAVRLGWSDLSLLNTEPGLAPLRDQPRFKALVEKARTTSVPLEPTRGFTSRIGWGPDGAPTPKQGLHYVLSTMLAVTSGRGNTVDEAIAALRTSAAADGTRPQGSFYFADHGDVRARTRKPLFEPVAAELKKLKLGAEIVQDVLPRDRADVLGAMLGSADLDWKESNSRLLPGAIAEHLTSLGGVMSDGAGQTPLSHWMRNGAAGSSGAVTEPYAIPEKFPSPWMHFHYANGCSLAEAFYQSIHGPYQLLIVGDPLCQPFAVFPKIAVEAERSFDDFRGRLKLEARVAADSVPVEHVEWFLDGVRLGITGPEDPSYLDTAQYADGPHLLVAAAWAKGRIATQGRAVRTIRIRNHQHSVSSEVVGPTAGKGSARLDQTFEIRVKAPGADRILLRHHAETIGGQPGPEATFTLPASVLGQGKVELVPLALFTTPDVVKVQGDPIPLSIEPAPLLPAIAAGEVPPLEPGLVLEGTAAGRSEPQSWPLEDVRGRWLHDLGLAPDAPWELTGWVDAGEGVHQLYVDGNLDVELLVDGVSIGRSAPNRWTLHPVPLAAGRHRIQVRGKAGSQPHLDLRFGRVGFKGLSSAEFSRPRDEAKPANAKPAEPKATEAKVPEAAAKESKKEGGGAK